ncbi:MAG: type II toxin-antitoxin system VapC family toxin [Planctomycetaceae bacterium]
MRLLLDTHAMLWADAEPGRLSQKAQSLLLDVENELLLSCASLWEMQIKVMLGKLTIRKPMPNLVNEWEIEKGLSVLPTTPRHIYEVSALPSIHNDPFDRMIVAVARCENATILSDDPEIKKYPVPVIW